MKILVVGSGGREHAIIKKIKENKKVKKIFALPGNGGIALDAECINIKATDIPAIVDFAIRESIDYAVVTPDDPLVLGLVDELEKNSIKCFGPNKAAAIIEGSKVFSKQLMQKYDIPTAKYKVFNNKDSALDYIKDTSYPVVIKADGLALGKGVYIAKNLEEAKNAIIDIMEDKIFGASGNQLVVEEFLEGPEVSVLAFTDGETLIPMISSMDHKRIGDGDTGLNTGGMGTVAPNPYYTKSIAENCMKNIFIPTIKAMNNEGRKFKGCLYFGLMLTKNGPKVIEYNCRFGDPETQVVLPLLKSDLLEVMMATTNETLKDMKVEFYDKNACCVILASNGYPKKYDTNFKLNIPDEFLNFTYVAGAKMIDSTLLTSGGRVVGCVGIEDTLKGAIDKAYYIAGKVEFENKYCRKDIGKRAMLALQEKN